MDKLHARGAAELVTWGDGSPTREFLYVEDAAEGIRLIASAEVANAQFFVTSDDRLTRRYRRSGGSLQICDPIDFVRAVAGSER